MGSDFEAWAERVDPDTHVVGVRGEIDIFTAPEFKQLINSAIEAGDDGIVVDLTETTFMDSSSLGVLIAAHRRLRLRGGRLLVVCSNRAVLSTFRITGLEGVFEILGSRDEALAAVAAA
jgi:anti-sigma B factor antagonist